MFEYDKSQKTLLHGKTTLTLMTRHAQRLLYGRVPNTNARRVLPEIIGLFKFAGMLRLIWQGAVHSDPYADYWLLKVDKELHLSQRILTEARQELAGAISALPREVNVTLAISANPVQIVLNFANPYAFIGAYLLGEYDYFARQALTARHIGVVSHTAAEKHLSLGGRCLRRAYASACGYRFLGIQRKDIIERNNKARSAHAQMGPIPDDVLDGILVASHSPRIYARHDEQSPPSFSMVAEAGGAERHANRAARAKLRALPQPSRRPATGPAA